MARLQDVLQHVIYFDHNATSPMIPEARQAWIEGVDKFIGNPSSRHRIGRRADNALAEARGKLAAVLGCDALDIVFTSGATEANNTVIQHFARLLHQEQEIWISAIEHPSVIEPAKLVFRNRLQLIPATRSGEIDLDWLHGSMEKRTPGAVAVMAANNETGVLQPWSQISKLCRERGIPFFCDATQWLGKLPARGLGECDFVSGSAHKFGGPRGTGFLKCPGSGKVHSLLHGGSQEESRRAGTENVPGVLSMIAALEKREAQLAAGGHELRLEWKQRFESCLLTTLAGAGIVGANAQRLWNTTTVLMPETDTCPAEQRWVVKLDKAGFAVSSGSACASGREEPSPVLAAMGYSPAESGRVLRFSSGWETAESDWHELLAAAGAVAARLEIPSQFAGEGE